MALIKMKVYYLSDIKRARGFGPCQAALRVCKRLLLSGENESRSFKMSERSGGGGQGGPIYLRQWVGRNVAVVTAIQSKHSGNLSNIVFDEKRLMYIVLDDRSVINFDHVVEIRLEK